MMGNRSFRRGAISLFAGLVFTGIAVGDGVKLTPSGYASFGMGQIVNAESDQPKGSDYTTYGGTNGPQYDHLLTQRMFVGFNLQTKFDPLPITTNLGVEMKIYNQTPRSTASNDDQGQSQRFYYFTYLTRADLNYTLGKEFNLDFGYFPFKYNPDSRNLGEYLFRSGTYPQYLITNFDFPMARVLGLNLSGSPMEGLNWDILANMNIDGAIMGDLNLTGIVSYQPVKALEVGAGVSFCSIVSANSGRTQPDYKSPTVNSFTGDMYTSGTDTLTYTFAGTKLMGRISIDPKELLPGELKSQMGANDLKLYSEVAVLGVKDYPISLDSTTRYDDITKRMPVMIGFNIPTFKILDVLSIEGEWFGSDYPNDMTAMVRTGIPVPLTDQTRTYVNGTFHNNYVDSKSDNWKWSLYAKKTLANHFQVTAQVARDHLRWELNDYGPQATYGVIEALRAPRNFYYTAKVGYSF